MTAESISLDSKVFSLGEDLLRYANTAGIHMFQPEQSRRSLTIIGNQDQGDVTLVFSFGGSCSHIRLHKWFFWLPMVRWIFARWLTIN